MGSVESKAKFIQTIDDRTTPVDAAGKVQTGSDNGTSKRGADVRALNYTRPRTFEPSTPAVICNQWAFITSYQYTDFFDEIGQALKIQGIILNQFENFNKAVMMHVYNEAPTIASAAGASYEVDEASQKNKISTIRLTGGANVQDGLFNVRGSLTLGPQGKDWYSGTTKDLWFNFVSDSSMIAFTDTDRWHMRINIK